MSDKVIEFLTDLMENWKVVLLPSGKTLTEVKGQRRLFQGDALTSLIFVTAIMLLSYIIWMFTGSINLNKYIKKIN